MCVTCSRYSAAPTAGSDEVSPRAKRIAGTVKRALQMIVRLLEGV